MPSKKSKCRPGKVVGSAMVPAKTTVNVMEGPRGGRYWQDSSGKKHRVASGRTRARRVKTEPEDHKMLQIGF